MHPRVARWFHCQTADFLGHGWTRFIHPEDQDFTVQAVNTIQAGIIPNPYVQRWRTTTGADIFVRIKWWLVMRPSGLWQIAGRITNLSAAHAGYSATSIIGRCQIPRTGTTDSTARGSDYGLPAGHARDETDRAVPAEAAAAIPATARSTLIMALLSLMVA